MGEQLKDIVDCEGFKQVLDGGLSHKGWVLVHWAKEEDRLLHVMLDHYVPLVRERNLVDYIDYEAFDGNLHVL